MLASISFHSLGPMAGESLLDLQDVLRSAPFGVSITPDAVEDGLVEVIPEPTAALLFAAGRLVVGRRRAFVRS